MPNQYVIIGGGVAAVHAAKAIRDKDGDGEITLFSEENSLPYNRIKLTKGLFTDLHSDKVLIKKEKWYDQNGIHVRLATRIAAIDPAGRNVVTDEGEKVSYDKLLICTGARNRPLPIEGATLANVHTIRGMDDTDRLKDSLQDGSRVVVVGGGVQGVETVWALHDAGHEVTVVEAAPRLMARQLDGTSSLMLKESLERAGVRVLLETGVTAISGSDGADGGTVDGVILHDGSRLACEHVVYSIGIVPNTDLAKAAGLQTRIGVIVNGRMESSDPHIFSAGDAAELNGFVEGLWGGAIEQGKIAGSNMAASALAEYGQMTGEEATSRKGEHESRADASGVAPETAGSADNGLAVYRRPVPVTLLNAFGNALFSIGCTDERECDIALAGEANGAHTVLFLKDNRLTGAVSWQGAAASLPYTAAIEGQPDLSGMDLAHTSVKHIMEQAQERLNHTITV